MAKDIFVIDKDHVRVPLDEYLGKKEEKRKKKEARKEVDHTERIPIKSKLKTKMVAEDTNKNGPVTIFSRRRIMQEELLKHVKSAPTTKSKIVALLLMGIPLTSKEYYNKLVNLCGGDQSTLGGVNGTLSLLRSTKLFEYITKVQPGGDGNRLGAQYYIDPEFKLTFDQAVKLSKTHLKAQPIKKKKEKSAEKSAGKVSDAMLTDMQFDIMNLVMVELNPILAKAQKAQERIKDRMRQQYSNLDLEIRSLDVMVDLHVKKFLALEKSKGQIQDETLEAVSDIDSISALLRHCAENKRKISIIIE